jgi:SAM-dependent MidA family methyltransferase
MTRQAEALIARGLPVPDAASLAHSERVAAHLRALMTAAGGTLSFAEFMQHALYAPGLGYYAAGATKLGPDGDFVTAPEISPLFGRVLAGQAARVLAGLPEPQVLELGAGSGALAVHVLGALAERGLAARYSILEVSADLRDRQQALLRRERPQDLARVEWLGALPRRFTGVVLANEVADALPVERFRKATDGVRQCRVKADDDGFGWCEGPAPGFLAAAVSRIEAELGAPLPAGYVSEVATALPAWIGELAGCLARGFVFLFDYGVSRREYYAPDRSGGWLRCHFRHRAHADPLILPGIQDITAWVDFSAVAEAASAAGLDIAGYVTQAHFLLHGGLARELGDFSGMPTAARTELARQVKMLTLPGEMGEHFKCIGLTRGDVATPEAFTAADRAHAL